MMSLFCCREQGALEQAAVSAQRQADDLRSRLAEAQSNWQLAQAAADAAAHERTQLLQQVSQELNRAALVEQVSPCMLTNFGHCTMRSFTAHCEHLAAECQQ